MKTAMMTMVFLIHDYNDHHHYVGDDYNGKDYEDHDKHNNDDDNNDYDHMVVIINDCDCDCDDNDDFWKGLHKLLVLIIL